MIRNIIIALMSLASISAYAVEFSFKDFQNARNTGYDAAMAYIDSITSVPEDFPQSVESLKADTTINLMAGAVHCGKTREEADILFEQAVILFNQKKAIMAPKPAMETALRLKQYTFAAQKFAELNSKLNAGESITIALILYKNRAITKDTCIDYLIAASEKNVGEHQLVGLTKAIKMLPKRDLSGAAFMTMEQKRTFYGNYLNLVEPTKASAEFLGICKTEYQLVK